LTPKYQWKLNSLSLSREACLEVLEKLRGESSAFQRVKAELAQRCGLKGLPGNAELYSALQNLNLPAGMVKIFRRKEVRRASGVLVVAVMTRPFPCPHGRCLYCPGGPAVGTPQSYTGREPAARRGAQYGYDPKGQVEGRLSQLKAIGHALDKVELIIMGGTFPAAPPEYQEWFVKGCLEGLIGRETQSLDEALELAEKAPIRNTAITVETRPDWAKEPQVNRMLRLGVTRVEIGVQTLRDEVYRLVERGHTVTDVVEATRILKDAGMKVCYHMMPGLPGSNFQADLEDFKSLFTNPDFRPDMLKIYPTLVLKGTRLHKLWAEGKYRPYPLKVIVDLLIRVKSSLPGWVRIQRIQRDIPAPLIVDGVKAGNLREIVQGRMGELGLKCRCIRCREAGHLQAKKGLKPNPADVRLIVERYEASRGLEIFLSYEDVVRDILVGWLRLRIPSEKAHRAEIRGRTAVIRELHVSGPMIPRGLKPEEGWQHKGYGRSLMAKAEKMASEEYDVRKLLVNSSLGVREYYFKLGYKRDGAYISKILS